MVAWCEFLHADDAKLQYAQLYPGAAPVQLMSELVRKAEADIDALRRRLAGLGAAGECHALVCIRVHRHPERCHVDNAYGWGSAHVVRWVAGGELSSCSQLDTNRSAQLLDAARSLGEDEAEAAAATAVAATAAGASAGRCPTLASAASQSWRLPAFSTCAPQHSIPQAQPAHTAPR